MRIVCDFETTIDEPARVYVWYAYIVESNTYHNGRDISSFIDFVKERPMSDLFFHNADFDGSFIVSYLLANGFKSNNKIAINNTKYIMGEFNSCTIYWDYGKYVNIIDTMELLSGSLYDFGLSVGLIKGNTQEEAMYTNEELENITEQDYKRAEDYCKLDVKILQTVLDKYNYYHLTQMATTKAQLAYRGLTQRVEVVRGIQKGLYADSYVTKPIHKLMIDKPIKIEKEITHNFVKVFNKNPKREEYFMKEEWDMFSKKKKVNYKVLEEVIETRKHNIITDISVKIANEFRDSMLSNIIGLKPYTLYNIGSKYTRFEDPKNTAEKDKLKVINEMGKLSYKGGITYVNPKYQTKWLKDKVYVYDINSMYPFIYSHYPIPDSLSLKGLKRDEKLKKDDLAIISISRLKAKLKPNKFPLIKLNTNTKQKIIKTNNIDWYLPKVDINQGFILNNPDYQYLIENYYIEDIKIKSIAKFTRNIKLENQLKKYTKHWYSIKENATSKIDKYFSKLMLNALYGKFGQYKTEYKDVEYIQHKNVTERLITRKYISSMFDADVLVASYITSYGRRIIADTVNKVGMDNFVYCDTDSLHLLINADGLINISSKIGDYKLEYVSTESRYIQPKLYGVTIDNEWITKAAGFTKKINKEEFKIGGTIPEKRKNLVEGGYIISDVDIVVGETLLENKDIIGIDIEREV